MELCVSADPDRWIAPSKNDGIAHLKYHWTPNLLIVHQTIFHYPVSHMRKCTHSKMFETDFSVIRLKLISSSQDSGLSSHQIVQFQSRFWFTRSFGKSRKEFAHCKTSYMFIQLKCYDKRGISCPKLLGKFFVWISIFIWRYPKGDKYRGITLYSTYSF